MATVDKDFKVKHGLVVEGTTATVNGEDIITTGSTTDSLPEGSTNVYYTEGRAKTDAAELLTGATLTNITITGDGSGLTITAENGGIQDLTGFDTDDLTEGTTNKYYANSLVDSHLNGGDGVTYSSGTISVDLGTGGQGLTTSLGHLAVDRTTVDTWYDAAGAASDVASDLSTHISDSSTHGVTGNIVGTTDTQTLTNKTANGLDLTGNTSFVDNSDNTYLQIFKSDNKTQFLSYPDLRLYSSSDIVIDATGTSYLGSAAAGNEIATEGYVDGLAVNYDVAGAAATAEQNAKDYADALVQGLNVKDSVRAASTANIADLNDVSNVIGGVTLSNGDRVLLKNQSDAGQNGIYVYEFLLKGKLTRAEDQPLPEKGDYVLVVEGTYAATGWLVSSGSAISGFTWTQFSAANEYTAGNGISISGNSIAIDDTVTATKTYVDTNFVNVADLPGQLDDYIPLTQKGADSGVATLDENGYVPLTQLGNVPAAYITSVDANEFTVSGGELNLTATPTFTSVDVNSIAKQVASTAIVYGGTIGVVSSFSYESTGYRSAEYLVKTKLGSETEISKILLTVEDGTLNIAITEYGNVSTNGSLSIISAQINGSSKTVELTVNNPDSISSLTVNVYGTLLR